MEICNLTFMVNIGQEVALLPLGVFLGIAFRFRQPPLAGIGQIIPQHPGQVSFMRQLECRRLWGFRCDVRFQVRCQFWLNILPGILSILR